MKIKLLTLNEIKSSGIFSSYSTSIFNRYDWLQIFNPYIKILGIYDDGDNLFGNFFLYKEKKFSLNLYRNPPYTPLIGPFFKVDARNPVNILNKSREVLSLMADFLDKLNYSIISVSLGRNIVDALPFIWKKFKVVPGYSYCLDLNKSLDELNKGMSVERRNDINKGIRDKLTAKKVDDFSIVKLLVLKTFSRQEKTVSEYYLDKILFGFINNSNSFAFAAFRKEKPIAVAFCVYDKTTAYYLLGGYDYEYKHHGAGALAMWEVIKYSKELGLRYFDFEGSMIPQIEKYFRGFGGELTPYFRVNKAKLPLEILLKFYRRELF